MPSYDAGQGQAIGPALAHWQGCAEPQAVALDGSYCRLEPLDLGRHAVSLFQAYQEAPDDSLWTYLSFGPFDRQSAYEAWVAQAQRQRDPLHFAVLDPRSGRAIGTLALMRIDARNGVVEVGSVVFSPLLQRSRVATEAQFLLMRHAFDHLGYRRYEWKCDHLNQPSRQAALRLGFQFEGIFRNAIVYKGRSRDTAWYALTQQDWPGVKAAIQDWLAPENFDDRGQQRRPLGGQRRMEHDLPSHLSVGQRLRHYKGGLYRVEGACLIEASLELGVLYRPEQGDARHVLWMRPASAFDEWVEWGQQQVRRFQPV